jgi:hypothetical protein
VFQEMLSIRHDVEQVRHRHEHNVGRQRHLALAQLREVRGDLLCARVGALQVSLSGARAQRARELTEKIADAIGHVERLMFFIEGDAC